MNSDLSKKEKPERFLEDECALSQITDPNRCINCESISMKKRVLQMLSEPGLNKELTVRALIFLLENTKWPVGNHKR